MAKKKAESTNGKELVKENVADMYIDYLLTESGDIGEQMAQEAGKLEGLKERREFATRLVKRISMNMKPKDLDDFLVRLVVRMIDNDMLTKDAKTLVGNFDARYGKSKKIPHGVLLAFLNKLTSIYIPDANAGKKTAGKAARLIEMKENATKPTRFYKDKEYIGVKDRFPRSGLAGDFKTKTTEIYRFKGRPYSVVEYHDIFEYTDSKWQELINVIKAEAQKYDMDVHVTEKYAYVIPIWTSKPKNKASPTTMQELKENAGNKKSKGKKNAVTWSNKMAENPFLAILSWPGRDLYVEIEKYLPQGKPPKIDDIVVIQNKYSSDMKHGIFKITELGKDKPAAGLKFIKWTGHDIYKALTEAMKHGERVWRVAWNQTWNVEGKIT